jgi:hypothetical protein
MQQFPLSGIGFEAWMNKSSKSVRKPQAEATTTLRQMKIVAATTQYHRALR